MLTANIYKIYRQINITSVDWYIPSEKSCEYELCTVTYGVLVSSFQAIRVLYQLEWEYSQKFTEAIKTLSTKTYVDDILIGAASIE